LAVASLKPFSIWLHSLLEKENKRQSLRFLLHSLLEKENKRQSLRFLLHSLLEKWIWLHLFKGGFT